MSIMEQAESIASSEYKWPLDMTHAADVIDLEDIAKAFQREESRLFQKKSDIDDSDPFSGEMVIEGLCTAKDGKASLVDDNRLEKFLEDSTNSHFRVMSDYSWSELSIFPNSARMLLSKVEVMPEFWHVLRAFGHKTKPIDESFGGVYQAENPNCSEFCYLVKHVENKQNDPGQPPEWSNRQMGVYHQHRERSVEGIEQLQDCHTFIIVNPPKVVEKMLDRMFSANSTSKSSTPKTPELIHTMIANSLTTRWKERISDIELVVLDKTNKTYLSSSDNKEDAVKFEFSFQDTQEVYSLRDDVLRLDTLLDINDRVFSTIYSRYQVYPDPKETSPTTPRYTLRIKSIRGETSQQRQRLETILKRLDGCCAVTQSIIQHEDNGIMKELGQKSRKDAQTTQSLTALALVFIPASFAAQVLSMGYIEFNQSNSLVKVSGGIIAFLVLSTICIIITATLWYYLQKWMEEQDQKEQEKLEDAKGSNSEKNSEQKKREGARGSNSEKNREQAVEDNETIMTQQGGTSIYEPNDIERGLGMRNPNVGMA